MVNLICSLGIDKMLMRTKWIVRNKNAGLKKKLKKWLEHEIILLIYKVLSDVIAAYAGSKVDVIRIR